MPFSFKNLFNPQSPVDFFPLPGAIYQAIEEKRRLAAQKEQEQMLLEMEAAKRLGISYKSDPHLGAHLFKRWTGTDIPVPKLGEETVEVPSKATPEAKAGLYTEKVKRGGVQVTPEVKMMGEMGFPEEAIIKKVSGWEAPQPPKPAPLIQEYMTWFQQQPPDADKSIVAFWNQRSQAFAKQAAQSTMEWAYKKWKAENPKGSFGSFLKTYRPRSARGWQLYERVAYELYGKSYYRLTQKEITEVEKLVFERTKATGPWAILGQILGTSPAGPQQPAQRFELIPED